MKSALFRSVPGLENLLLGELWSSNVLGIIEEPLGLRAFFEDDVDLAAIVTETGASLLETREEVPSGAPLFSNEDWDPISVGQRLWIAPSWIATPTPPGRTRVTIDGSNAFGSGRHESTQLMLEALEQKLTPSLAVLDIGCGSGILSQAAHLLGARSVVSCDIHPDAIQTARQNLETPLFLGSADALQSSLADLVLVNISAPAIDTLAPELARVAKPDGLLILSGFIRQDTPTSFTPTEVLERDDWLCWLCRPDSLVRAESNRTPGQSYALDWW